jgi:GAF domain-containing protein
VKPFTDHQINLMQSLGARAALAIDNARFEIHHRAQRSPDMRKDFQGIAKEVGEMGRPFQE